MGLRLILKIYLTLSNKILRFFAVGAFIIFGAVHLNLSHSEGLNSELGSQFKNLRFKRLLNGEGVNESDSINAITAITQDSRGYMWFCGESGVARYNGTNFDVFQKTGDPASLSGSYAWDVVEDKDGVIWIATDYGLNRFSPEGHNFTRYTVEVPADGIQEGKGIPSNILYSLAVGDDNTLYIGSPMGLFQLNPERTAFTMLSSVSGGAVHDILMGAENDLWAGTSTKGLFHLNLGSGATQFWTHNPQDDTSIPWGDVRSVEMGNHGEIWVGTFGGGAARLNAERAVFTRYEHDPTDSASIGSNHVWDVHMDKEGYLWLATDPGGLALYSPATDNFRSFNNSIYDSRSLISDKVRTVFDDRSGDVWVGTYPSGVSYFDKSTAVFVNESTIPNDPTSLSDNMVLTFFEDSSGTLWVGTEAGFNSYDVKRGEFTQFLASPGEPQTMQSDSILAIEEDVSGALWLGTWSGGAYRFDKQSKSFTHYVPDDENPNSIPSLYIWSLLRDSQNRLWLGTERSGLSLYRPETDDFVTFRPNTKDPTSLSFSHVWTLMEDSKQRLWVGTIDGLNLLESIEGGRAQFKHYWHDPNNSNSLSSNRIVSLFEDSNKNLWVGTQDAGLNLFDPETGEARRISVVDGLPSNHISSIVEDDEGFIWLGTINGLARIDPESMVVKTFSESNGLVSNNFSRDASYKDRHGRLYFGGSKGLSVFDPTQFSTAESPAEVVLSNLYLFNKPVYANTEGSPLPRPIGDLNEITLSYEYSMFSFEFFAINYRVSNRHQYSYKLEGFDKHWNDVFTNVATYTNIDPGEYLFRVRTANSSGAWSEEGAAIRVVITPPLWETTFAYCVYIVLFGLAIWFLLNSQRKKVELVNERKLNANLVKLDRVKDTFLANTSHELRTPLNGIIGLAESLQSGTMGEVSSDMLHSLKMISLSGRRLSSLINDILDYSKLQESELDVQLVDVNLHAIVNIVVELLSPLIGSKQLKLINSIPEGTYVRADGNRLQQILLNLAGNGLKFSKNGFVSLSAEREAGDWIVSVEDSGAGMSMDSLNEIFDVFTQLDNKDANGQGGTGLGLAITKQLVELHGGTLAVKSKVGSGSVFKFNLKEGERPDYEPESVGALDSFDHELYGQNAISHDLIGGEAEGDDHLSLLKPRSMCSYRILIVDDDAVNRLVLSSILSIQKYTVIEAESGVEAIELLNSGVHIDLVIMDVMMPKMSGYEACMRIRVDFPVHILPLLFLTAKHFNTDIIRGFVAGGSDFLKKPVSKHDLLSRVSTHLSMLDISRRLEGKYLEVQQQNAHNGRELKVLEHIVDVINREIDFKKILKEMLENVQLLIEADRVVFWQAKREGDYQYSALDVEMSAFNEICLNDGGAITTHLTSLYEEGHSIVILEDLNDPDFVFVAETFPGCKSSVLMTICFEGEVIGFITILIYGSSRRFSEDTIATLNRLHTHITSAIIKAKLLERLNMDVSELKADKE